MYIIIQYNSCGNRGKKIACVSAYSWAQPNQFLRRKCEFGGDRYRYEYNIDGYLGGLLTFGNGLIKLIWNKKKNMEFKYYYYLFVLHTRSVHGRHNIVGINIYNKACMMQTKVEIVHPPMTAGISIRENIIYYYDFNYYHRKYANPEHDNIII